MAAELECPYVGLRPFREADHPFFFGRERDIRVITSNLLAKPLTVLYGASGVGKSSVLQAGVFPNVCNLPNTAVLYYNEWQDAGYMQRLAERCRDASGCHEPGEIDEVLAKVEKRFVLILDQFEEFLLYHTADGGGEALDAALARIVNRSEVKANVLIGIREDALSQFDQRFSIRIGNLLGNTLALTHLRPEAARSAITKPLDELNRRIASRGQQIEIEPKLVEEVVRQVQSGDDGDAQGAGKPTHSEGRIETAYLQLVMRRLWDEERKQGSSKLRLATLLERIGGARQIVRTHVANVMEGLPEEEDREAAASMFRYLVTPSRTKIAQATPDLVSYTDGADPQRVSKVLSLLTDRPDARILRRLASPERYEIFHDVLAQPILEWRRGYLEAKERAKLEESQRAEAERQRKELEQAHKLAAAETARADAQKRAATMFLWMAAVLGVALLAAVGAAFYARNLKVGADRARAVAEAATDRAREAEADAKAARADAEAARLRTEAALALAKGESEKAKKLEAEAQGQRTKAEDMRAIALQQAQEFDKKRAGLTEEQRAALHENEQLRSQLDQARKDVESANREVARLRSQIAEAGNKAAQYTKPTETAQRPIAGKRTLRLLYVDVIRDGSGGTTGWSFTVTADGRTIWKVVDQRVSDVPGRNRIRVQGTALDFDADAVPVVEITGDHSRGQTKPARARQSFGALGQTGVLVESTPYTDGTFHFVFSLDERRETAK